MADDVIERLAVGIAIAHGHDPYGRLYGDTPMWTLYEGDVKAALAALRPGDKLPGGLVVVPAEPSDAMQIAGQDQHFKVRCDFEPAGIYRAMIAAARPDRVGADG